MIPEWKGILSLQGRITILNYFDKLEKTHKLVNLKEDMNIILHSQKKFKCINNKITSWEQQSREGYGGDYSLNSNLETISITIQYFRSMKIIFSCQLSFLAGSQPSLEQV